MGYLYTRVETFVREREGASGVGMIEQSLCHHLQEQLTEYYRLIAVLESQMGSKGGDAGANPDADGTSTDPREEETGLTLRRLDVWINEWRLRMRMMSVCVEGARGTSYTFPHVTLLYTHGFLRCARRRPGQLDSWVYRQR